MALRLAPRPKRVSPDDPSLSSDAPCPLPRRIGPVHLSMTSQPVLPAPSLWRVGIRIKTFEACSGFTRIAARTIAQLPKPLSRGFDPASHPAKPLVSYRTHRHLSGWNLPPPEKRACRAHTGKTNFGLNRRVSPR